MRYKLLFGAIIALLPAYSGYWYFIAGQIRDATDTFKADIAEEGVELQFTAKTVSGFPYRLILDYENPSMSGPGWSWQAPKVKAFAQPYDLTRYIISAPGPHQVELISPGGFPTRITLAAESARASLDYTNQSQLKQVDVDIQSLTYRNILAELGLEADRLQIHLRPTPDSDQNTPNSSLDLAFKTDDLKLPNVSLTSLLGQEVRLMQFTLTLHGISSIEALGLLPVLLENGQDVRLAINQAGLIWGTLNLTAKGELALDDFNRPEGEIQLTISGHEEFVNRLESAGLIKPGIAGTARATLGALAAMNNGKAIVTITFREGLASAGLLRLGELTPLF